MNHEKTTAYNRLLLLDLYGFSTKDRDHEGHGEEDNLPRHEGQYLSAIAGRTCEGEYRSVIRCRWPLAGACG